MPPQIKKRTREEKLERRRQKERERRRKLRSDPIRYAEFKAKEIRSMTPPRHRQTREERLEKKRIAERERKKRIKSNPMHYARLAIKENDRLRYSDILRHHLVKDKDNTTSAAKPDVKAVKLETDESDSDGSLNDPLYEDPVHIEVHSPTDVLNTIETQNRLEEAPRAEGTYLRNPDEFEALGLSIAAKVRRMDSTQRIYAELLIQKVLAKGLLMKLNDTTDITDKSY